VWDAEVDIAGLVVLLLEIGSCHRLQRRHAPRHRRDAAPRPAGRRRLGRPGVPGWVLSAPHGFLGEGIGRCSNGPRDAHILRAPAGFVTRQVSHQSESNENEANNRKLRGIAVHSATPFEGTQGQARINSSLSIAQMCCPFLGKLRLWEGSKGVCRAAPRIRRGRCAGTDPAAAPCGPRSGRRQDP